MKLNMSSNNNHKNCNWYFVFNVYPYWSYLENDQMRTTENTKPAIVENRVTTGIKMIVVTELK